jgi:uncharacterized protein (DUF1810 family)
MTSATFHLQRFVDAQASVFEVAVAELSAGRKRSHWMWFIFPQLRGLGHSPTAQFFAIASLDEARAYYAHSLLGPRLERCTETVLKSRAHSLNELFGSPDDLKFRSCMTLFEIAVPSVPLFGDALDRWCGGERDERTLQLLAKQETR